MNVPSWMWHLPTWPVTPSAISSPASADGASQPDSPAGPTTVSCGPAPRRASRSRSRDSSAAPMTIGTCGPTCFASSVPDGPLSSWENRLRQRLARTGSTECFLTWKASATPAGRSLSRLVPSMLRTSVIAFGLWPTMTSNALAKNGYNEAGNSAGQVAIRKIMLGLWSTLRASDGAKGGPNQSFGAGGCPLPSQVFQVGSSSNAPMENGAGSLHPEFGGWELGFPPEWDACAPTAMPSSRKSRPK